jgi:DNA-binding NarL/FixJ family response regulator
MMAEARDDPERDIASRVLIIDDSAAVRQGLRALVETDASLRTVGEASNAAEGLELARSLSPDLILLDNEMPGMNGIELLPTLVRVLPTERRDAVRAVEVRSQGPRREHRRRHRLR